MYKSKLAFFLTMAFMTNIGHLAFITNVGYANIPLEITSNTMTCERLKGFCIAEGHAEAIYGDGKTEPQQILKADKFTVTFKKEKNKPQENTSEESILGGQQVEEIHADGDVSYVRGDLIIHSDRAEYSETSSIVHFFGHVRIKEGERAYSESEHATYDRSKNTFTIHTQAKMIIDTHDKENRHRSK